MLIIFVRTTIARQLVAKICPNKQFHFPKEVVSPCQLILFWSVLDAIRLKNCRHFALQPPIRRTFLLNKRVRFFCVCALLGLRLRLN